MRIDPQKCLGYIKEMQSLRGVLEKDATVATFKRVDEQLAWLFDRAKREQPDFFKNVYHHHLLCQCGIDVNQLKADDKLAMKRTQFKMLTVLDALTREAIEKLNSATTTPVTVPKPAVSVPEPQSTSSEPVKMRVGAAFEVPSALQGTATQPPANNISFNKYIQELSSLKDRLNTKQQGITLQQIGQYACEVVERVCREQPQTKDRLYKFVNEIKVAVTAPKGYYLHDAVTINLMRSRLDAELRNIIDELQTPPQPAVARPGNVPSEVKSSSDPKFKLLQEQLEMVAGERDRAIASLAEEKKLCRQFSEKLDALRQQQSGYLKQQEQEHAAKLSKAQQQFRDELQQAKLEHSKRVAALKNEHSVELQCKEAQLTETAQRLNKTMQMLKQLHETNDRHEQKIAALMAQMEELQGKPTSGLTPAVTLDTLRERHGSGMSGCPAALVDFVTHLLEVADRLDANNLAWLTSDAGMDRLDQTVYQSPDLAAVLAGPEAADVGLLTGILNVQLELHQRLHETGIEMLRPSISAKFVPGQHACAEGDIVHNNSDPALHDTILSVKRIGFALTADQKVLRRAKVRRYQYQPNNAETEAKPQAVVFRREPASSSLQAASGRNESKSTAISDEREQNHVSMLLPAVTDEAWDDEDELVRALNAVSIEAKPLVAE